MYEIFFQPPAERFLKKIDNHLKERIIRKIEELSANPRIGIPLTGNLSGLWKLRIGDYRAIYQIFENRVIVSVLRIGHRKNVYE